MVLPVRLIPTVSKILETFLNKHIVHYVEPYLSSLLCGFRKGYNAQRMIIPMLEKRKTTLDKG